MATSRARRPAAPVQAAPTTVDVMNPLKIFGVALVAATLSPPVLAAERGAGMGSAGSSPNANCSTMKGAERDRCLKEGQSGKSASQAYDPGVRMRGDSRPGDENATDMGKGKSGARPSDSIKRTP